MKQNGKQTLKLGGILLGVFALWTGLIQCVDVRPAGQNGTNIGFAALNVWFHDLTGVHMTLYTVTDWLGLVPIVICLGFGVLGLLQLVKRRSLFKVDTDIRLVAKPPRICEYPQKCSQGGNFSQYPRQYDMIMRKMSLRYVKDYPNERGGCVWEAYIRKNPSES